MTSGLGENPEQLSPASAPALLSPDQAAHETSPSDHSHSDPDNATRASPVASSAIPTSSIPAAPKQASPRGSPASLEQPIASTSKLPQELPGADHPKIPKSKKQQEALRNKFRKGQADALLRINGEIVTLCTTLASKADKDKDQESAGLLKDLRDRLGSNLGYVYAMSQPYSPTPAANPPPILTEFANSDNPLLVRLIPAYTHFKRLHEACTSFEKQVLASQTARASKSTSGSPSPMKLAQPPTRKVSSGRESIVSAPGSMGPPALPAQRDDDSKIDGQSAKRRKLSGPSMTSMNTHGSSSPFSLNNMAPPNNMSKVSPASASQQIINRPPSASSSSSSSPKTMTSMPVDYPTLPATSSSTPFPSMSAIDQSQNQAQQQQQQQQQIQSSANGGPPTMHPVLMQMAQETRALQQKVLQLGNFIKSAEFGKLTHERQQEALRTQTASQQSLTQQIHMVRSRAQILNQQNGQKGVAQAASPPAFNDGSVANGAMQQHAMFSNGMPSSLGLPTSTASPASISNLQQQFPTRSSSLPFASPQKVKTEENSFGVGGTNNAQSYGVQSNFAQLNGIMSGLQRHNMFQQQQQRTAQQNPMQQMYSQPTQQTQQNYSYSMAPPNSFATASIDFAQQEKDQAKDLFESFLV